MVDKLFVLFILSMKEQPQIELLFMHEQSFITIIVLIFFFCQYAFLIELFIFQLVRSKQLIRIKLSSFHQLVQIQRRGYILIKIPSHLIASPKSTI